LLNQKAVLRAANFGNSVLQLFAPRLYNYYASTLQAVCDRDPKHLRRNFDGNVFASATFNLGPRTVSYVHTDHLNLPWGWCAITAVGDFDPTLGGHLVLWDLKIIHEFLPGSTVLIPSAILRHSNTGIGAQEHRYSFTQYTAGGVFRWVECGFKAAKNLSATEKQEYIHGAGRWRRGVDMFSFWSEFSA
ncbi:hypothetical protein BV20DRAFT_958811, partial [Pilatotrama ljubarskyi]